MGKMQNPTTADGNVDGASRGWSKKTGKIKGNGVNLGMKIDELTGTLELTDIGDLAKNANTVKKLEKLVRLGEGVLQDIDEERRGETK